MRIIPIVFRLFGAANAAEWRENEQTKDRARMR